MTGCYGELPLIQVDLDTGPLDQEEFEVWLSKARHFAVYCRGHALAPVLNSLYLLLRNKA